MRARDPRVERPESPRPPAVARIRAALVGPPGTWDGLTFQELRRDLGEPGATDGELHQALIDEGYEVEED